MQKPRFYLFRLYFPYFGFFIVLFFLHKMNSLAEIAIFVSVASTIGLIFRYFFDHKEISLYIEYEEALEKQKTSKALAKSNVNENIKNYLEESKAKKSKAKWWQIWI